MKLAPLALSLVLTTTPAFAQVVGGGEINPTPGKISTLAAQPLTETSIRLTWTAVGADGPLLGGPAASYQIRRHSVAITTTALWTAATVVPQVMVPKAPGAIETFDVTGLAPETLYYFNVRAVDVEGAIGLLSNSPGATTPSAPDLTPPAAVADLVVGGTTLATATLTWTVPSDAQACAMRYRTGGAFTQWDEAGYVDVTPPPPAGTPGLSQEFVVTGLADSTTYFFCVRTADAALNWSAISNSPAGTTLSPPPPDTTAPAVVVLQLIEATQDSITIGWIAPGDDGAAGGPAVSVALYYSTAGPLLDDADYAGATPVPGMPSPRTPGDFQSVVVVDLAPGLLHHFGMIATDDASNSSRSAAFSAVTQALPVLGSDGHAALCSAGTAGGGLAMLLAALLMTRRRLV